MGLKNKTTIDKINPLSIDNKKLSMLSHPYPATATKNILSCTEQPKKTNSR